MPRHNKKRAMSLVCAHCGSTFVSGSNAQTMCSLACRVKHAALQFTGVAGCWEWPLSRNVKNGYGQISTWSNGRRKVLYAHRSSYNTFVGPIPKHLFVLHKCDNRPCFNPDHLFLGTALDNSLDMDSKGRRRIVVAKVHWTALHPDKIPRGSSYKKRATLSGSKHPGSKLSEHEVTDILASNETLISLAKRYSVSSTTIWQIKSRKTWKRVTPSDFQAVLQFPLG